MIELSRAMPFGQFVNNGSPLVRMDPRIKITILTVLVIALTLIKSWWAMGLCLLLCVLIFALSRLPLGFVLNTYKPLLYVMPMFMFFQIFFYYPATPVEYFWQWGIFSLSWSGIQLSLQLFARALLLYFLTTMFLFLTSLVDITDGLEGILAPLQRLRIPTHIFVVIVVIAFKFVPIFIKELEQLIKAQASRGVPFETRNPFRKAILYGRLLLPLFVRGFKKAETLSVAMEARGYGLLPGWQRGKRRVLRIERFDVLALLVSLLIAAGMLVMNSLLP